MDSLFSVLQFGISICLDCACFVLKILVVFGMPLWGLNSFITFCLNSPCVYGISASSTRTTSFPRSTF